MIYQLQSLGLKVRFAWLLVLWVPVLGFQWLLMSAPWALARLQVVSGGAGLPDVRFWYTPSEIRTMLDAWGAQGREVYLTVLWPTDTGFLLAYAALLGAASLYLLKKLNPGSPWWFLAALLPAAGAGFDFLENALTALTAVLPAGDSDPAVWVGAFCTAGKWTALGATAVFLVGGTLFHLGRSSVRRFRASRPPAFEPLEPEEPGRN